VLDFGIAKFMQRETELTGSGVGIGTPLYMSPEQLSDAASISPRSDVWALGVVLYELIAGVSPFAADSAGAVVAAVMLEQPVPLERLRAELPPGLAALVHRCLSKDPNQRFSSARALAKALRPFGAEPESTSVSIKIPVVEPAREPSKHPDIAGAIEQKVDSFKPASLRPEAPTHVDGARRVPSLSTLAGQLQSMRHAESAPDDTRVGAPRFSSLPAKARTTPSRWVLSALAFATGASLLWNITRERTTAAVASPVEPSPAPKSLAIATPAAPTASAAPTAAAARREESAPRKPPPMRSRVLAPAPATKAPPPPPPASSDGKPLHL